MRTLVLDSQILNSVQLCGRKYKFEFGDRFQTIEKSQYLAEGDVLHRMLQTYYNLKKYQHRWNGHPYSYVVDACTRVGSYFAARNGLDFDETEGHFRDYCTMYEHEGFEIIAVEQVACKELFNDGELQVLYQGKIDLQVRHRDLPLLPIDHKKHRQRRDPALLSNQLIGYCWLLGVWNIMINEIGFQKTLKPEERFRRHIMSYPPSVIEEWKANTLWWARLLALYVDTGFFPANLTSCDKYGGCIFQGVCTSEPNARIYKLERDFMRGEAWDVGKELK